MVSELSGQLTSDWIIPRYARDSLWLEGNSGAVRVEGEHGQFKLDAPAQLLTLRWGGADGPALLRLPWEEASLDWNGSVAVGGYVDAMHLTEIPAMAMPLLVLFLGGQPLVANTQPYPDGKLRARTPYLSPDFHTGISADVPETVTTWLVGEDSALGALAEDGLINNLRLHFFGSLADDESVLVEHFALPILLESVTLFAP